MIDTLLYQLIEVGTCEEMSEWSPNEPVENLPNVALKAANGRESPLNPPNHALLIDDHHVGDGSHLEPLRCGPIINQQPRR